MTRNSLRFLCLALLASSTTWAAGLGFSWETGLQRIEQSLTGSTAWLIGVICLVGAGATAYGMRNEISQVFHHISGTVIIVGLLVGAVGVMTILFGGAGALV